MKILCVIPSRINSTRLPRKPLLPIQGKPMIQCVYENASHCDFLYEVVVATDSDEIASIIRNSGGKAIMTDPDIPTGSERAAAVAEQYHDVDIVINLQGDEPFIQPFMLKELVLPFLNNEKEVMTTLAYPLTKDKYHSPATVKVITDLHHHAIYFSRSAIPYYRTEQTAPVYNHMGVYAFSRDFLLAYNKLPQTPLEKTESLEQLRVIEHGYKIRVCLLEKGTLEINTPEEYAEAQNFKL